MCLHCTQYTSLTSDMCIRTHNVSGIHEYRVYPHIYCACIQSAGSGYGYACMLIKAQTQYHVHGCCMLCNLLCPDYMSRQPHRPKICIRSYCCMDGYTNMYQGSSHSTSQLCGKYTIYTIYAPDPVVTHRHTIYLL